MRFLILLCALFAGTAYAADLAAGKTGYSSCAACHGANGEGNAQLLAPNIGGMDSAYIERQLGLFRRGVRGEGSTAAATMRAAVAVLKSDGEQSAVAAYVASLPRKAASASLKGDLVNGRNYYNGICSACHDSSGKGNLSLFSPRLAGIDVLYLQRQYAAFKSGARGAHADDKLGKQMRAMTKALPDEKTEHDVLAYIATLKL
jgi:cytochrome c oxidase subunit 2